MPLKLKVILSILFVGLSTSSVFYAWSPLMVTYIPIDQAYNFSAQNVEVIELILSSRNELQASALKVSSLLILVSLFVTLVLIWVPGLKGKKGT